MHGLFLALYLALLAVASRCWADLQSTESESDDIAFNPECLLCTSSNKSAYEPDALEDDLGYLDQTGSNEVDILDQGVTADYKSVLSLSVNVLESSTADSDSLSSVLELAAPETTEAHVTGSCSSESECRPDSCSQAHGLLSRLVSSINNKQHTQPTDNNVFTSTTTVDGEDYTVFVTTSSNVYSAATRARYKWTDPLFATITWAFVDIALSRF